MNKGGCGGRLVKCSICYIFVVVRVVMMMLEMGAEVDDVIVLIV